MLSDVGDVDSASEDYDSDDNSSVEETGEDATEREDEGRESFNTLMKLMDDEISSTAVDQSFEKVKDGVSIYIGVVTDYVYCHCPSFKVALLIISIHPIS